MTTRDAEDLVLMSTASWDSEFEVIPVTARLLAYLVTVKPGGPARTAIRSPPRPGTAAASSEAPDHRINALAA